MEIPMGLYARPLRSRLGVDRLRQIGWTRLHVGKALRWCNVPLTYLITRFRLSTSPSYCNKVAATANMQPFDALSPQSQLEIPRV
jgi:hypothetical protein